MAASYCITLYDCQTGNTVYYETSNVSAADQIITAVGIGNVVQITDPANFPNQYYILQAACDIFEPACIECVSDPNKIFDIPGASLQYWNTTEYGSTCPQAEPTAPAYVLLNCKSNIEFTNPDDIDQSPATALVTSTDLSLYVGMVINIAQYPGECYSVLGPYTENTGCPCNEYTVTEGYADCTCCLPPAPDPTCCEIPKYTQKPVHKYYLVTDQDCDIKTNTKFANNYYRYYATLRYGIKNCCEGVDMDKLWIQKEMSDYRKMEFGTCTGTIPDLCLYVVGSGACGSQTAEYNEFINGKWSWLFTRDTGVVGILYWDNVNNYWISANYDTGAIAARLKIYSDYPLGSNEEWETVDSLSCLSPASGLSTWLIPCELCPAPTPTPCLAPEDIIATGSFT